MLWRPIRQSKDHPTRSYRYYDYLLREKIKIRKYILTITDAEDIDMLSVKGSVHIARTAGLI